MQHTYDTELVLSLVGQSAFHSCMRVGALNKRLRKEMSYHISTLCTEYLSLTYTIPWHNVLDKSTPLETLRVFLAQKRRPDRAYTHTVPLESVMLMDQGTILQNSFNDMFDELKKPFHVIRGDIIAAYFFDCGGVTRLVDCRIWDGEKITDPMHACGVTDMPADEKVQITKLGVLLYFRLSLSVKCHMIMAGDTFTTIKDDINLFIMPQHDMMKSFEDLTLMYDKRGLKVWYTDD